MDGSDESNGSFEDLVKFIPRFLGVSKSLDEDGLGNSDLLPIIKHMVLMADRSKHLTESPSAKFAMQVLEYIVENFKKKLVKEARGSKDRKLHCSIQ